ncbi:hypothetical protein ASZ78_014570 [Callipepla squamata]|uniref:Uncharacterized protein n=1 Tax=Callipepla squamata TaxID=9009 RepID=A0A226NLJ0_CALSU|nr:hypothetical protein ASZ78_014570 [Callipepla squamata]
MGWTQMWVVFLPGRSVRRFWISLLAGGSPTWGSAALQQEDLLLTKNLRTVTGTRNNMQRPAETPMGYIAENLLKAQEIAFNDSRVPEQLKNYLQKALVVALGLEPYLDAMATSKSTQQTLINLLTK